MLVANGMLMVLSVQERLMSWRNRWSGVNYTDGVLTPVNRCYTAKYMYSGVWIVGIPRTLAKVISLLEQPVRLTGTGAGSGQSKVVD